MIANPSQPDSATSPSATGHWGAVFALTLCVSTLIASEFMPVSLLTPIAASLHASEGQAGGAIAVSGLFAVVTSLLISSLTRGIDRRHLLLGLTALMLVSGLVTSLAPNFITFMAGRALIGMVIGGFWSLSTAVVMQLVPARDVSKGLAMLNGGNALATTIAAPLGSFLGQFIGWRGAFFLVVPLAAVVLIWQFFSLPSIRSDRSATGAGALRLLGRRSAALGIAGATLMFMGQFALFTYLRPFLETVTQVNTTGLSLLLLVMGVSGLVGNALIARFIARSLKGTLVWIPALMAVLAAGLIAFGANVWTVGAILVFWGMIGTAAPVAWFTWLSRTLPDDTEAGGGLMVAAIQMAITLGAAAGGVLFDHAGHYATFGAAALILIAATVVAFIAPMGSELPEAEAEADGGDEDMPTSVGEAYSGATASGGA